MSDGFFYASGDQRRILPPRFPKVLLPKPLELRVLVCGDREWTDKHLVCSTLDHIKEHIAYIIEGECRGPDVMARDWCIEVLGKDKVLRFPAKWTELGRRAGPIRNQQMVTECHPDLVIAFHDHITKSKGTADMLDRSKKAGIPRCLVTHKNPKLEVRL